MTDDELDEDERYWADSDRFVQRFWAAMPMADRIELVIRTGVPPAIAVSATVPMNAIDYADLWVALYQDINL